MVGSVNQHVTSNKIENIEINSVAQNVGSLAGTIYGTAYCRSLIILNSKIKGTENVGGFVGLQQASEISRTYAEVEVIGSNNVGGMVGKLSNNNMTAVSNTSYIFHNYIANSDITGDKNVGGIIGNVVSDLYMPESFYYSNYVEADLSSTDINSISLGIGGRQNQNQYLKDTYYYKYATINGENPNEQNELFITQDKYLTEEELKNQMTYTSKIKWSALQWNFSILKNNKYPTINTGSFPDKEGIDLPVDSEHIVGNVVDTNTLENEMVTEELEQTFDYDNKEIQTYSTYSLIIAEDGTQATRNEKLYVKDNNLYAIPSTLSESANGDENIVPVANNLILDSYNGKEYETVLGSDGKIYDLKEPITYPENFANSDIESIGNNLNSEVKEVEVTYKNGDKIKFNYQTGEIISFSEAEDTEKVGLFDYLKGKIAEIGDTSANEVSQEITTKYKASKELQTKLEETSVEEELEKQNNSNQLENGVATTENNSTNNSLKENKYISIYNQETEDYEIYNEEELLDTSKEEVVSENEKIKANNLSEYYASEGESRNTKMGIVWIVISIIGVGIILIILKKNLKKKA